MAEYHSPWFTVSRLTKTVWRIEEAGLVSEYLVAGADRVLLIDCGFGIGDIAEVVARLTSLLLTVVNTHGHIDHTGGNDRFPDPVFIHVQDVPVLDKACEQEERRAMLARFPKAMLPHGFREQAWLCPASKDYHTIADGHRFDLGGRVVDVIETPGHTPGSVCLYDRNERLLFVGDSILEDHTLLMLPECLPLATYLDSMEKLAAAAAGAERVLPGHGPLLGSGVLREMPEGLRKVIDRKMAGTMETTAMGVGRVIGFGSCGIKYDESRLR